MVTEASRRGYAARVPTTVADNPSERRFEIRVDGKVAGFSEYRPAGENLIVSHTEIDQGHKVRALATCSWARCSARSAKVAGA
jgi:hypothetical protein